MTVNGSRFNAKEEPLYECQKEIHTVVPTEGLSF